MLKKIAKGLVIGGAALTLAATAAQAGQIDVNIYGASAQYKFWTKAAPKFLVDDQKCNQADVWSASGKKLTLNGFSKRDAGIAICAGDVTVGGKSGQGVGGAGVTGTGYEGSTVVIRYTTNASYDGIRAVMADADFTNPDASCSGYNERGQAVASAGDLVAHYPANNSTISALGCAPVHVGASDVAATTFNQVSRGSELGHLGGDWKEIDMIYPDNVKDPVAEGFQADRPIVVPFAFFRNANPANPVPYTNLTRLMATSLFSSQVVNWNEFDPANPDLDAVICLRHAGSGTHATIDAAVLRGDVFLPLKEVNTNSSAYQAGLSPLIWFNKGSSQVVDCVNDQLGAVGYADANKCVGNDDCVNVEVMTFQGAEAVSNTIKHGQYDFWAPQWLYSKQTGNTKTVIDDLVAFASDEANLDPGYAQYWAAQNAMKWEKLSDFEYPTKK